MNGAHVRVARKAVAAWFVWPIYLSAGCLATPAVASRPQQMVATFSCVGMDPETGDLGIAVQSRFFAVGAVVPWARADVGAIATQAMANTAYGPRGLDLLAEGKTPEEVLTMLTGPDSLRDRRQVGIVDAKGRSVTYTGEGCMTWAGGIAGSSFAAQGNILAGEAVVRAMAETFQSTRGWLGDRLLAALDAGQAAGGDARGMQSAALLIVRRGAGYGGYNDRWCDLRVDDAKDPFAEIHRLYAIWKPNALVTEGYSLVEKGDFEGAYALGREAIALQPQAGEYRYHMACYLSRGNQKEEAISALAEALRLEPSLAKQAATDPDLTPMKEDPRFGRMLEAATKGGHGTGE